MKVLSAITFGLLTTTSLLANTTMCFKENHTSMTTIETTPLDGGECNSTKSINDMKKEGWIVDDIKIESSSNGNNYIYILKKETINASSLDEEKLEARIMQKLEKRKEAEKAEKIIQIKEKMSKDGKKFYINKCQSCHGEKAEKKAYGTSRPLIDLSLEDMQLSIRDYRVDDYDRGNAFVMKRYVNILTEKRIKDIYSYIKTLKPKKEESK